MKSVCQLMQLAPYLRFQVGGRRFHIPVGCEPGISAKRISR